MTTPTVLLTGVTGFLGGAAAVELLLRHRCQLLLLVRADGDAHAAARVRQSLARFADLSSLDGPPRYTLIRGDLTDAATLADPRLDRVTHVLHLAANTSFRSVRGVRHTNILGTLALAHRMRRVASLVRFLYVGTAYICGADPPAVVHEDDYPRADVRHLAEYTASKAECEMLLERTAPELPLVVARPSVVVGHTRLGCLPSASIFWYYRALALLGRFPAPLETRKDICPVDYAARALLHLLFAPHLRHDRYHISAGTVSAVSWQELADGLSGGHSPSEPRRVVDFATLLQERDRLGRLLGPGNEDQLLAALEAYYRFSRCGVEVFDNRRLLSEGMPPPPRFVDYLRQCLTLPPDRSVYQQMLDDC